MTDAAPKIVLLGRPGPAREHLHRALADLGGEITFEGEPGDLDPGDVIATRPSAVVVSLDPAIEDQLDAWEALFATDGVNVVFDDAETTSQLEGWDLARWARHLAAKILGTDQTLPPPPDGAEGVRAAVDWMPSPGGPPSPAAQMDAERLEDYAVEALDLADSVPIADDPGRQVETADAGAGSEDFDWSLDEVADGADEVELELDADVAALAAGMDTTPADAPLPTSHGDDDADSAQAQPEGQMYSFGRPLELLGDEAADEDDGSGPVADAAGDTAATDVAATEPVADDGLSLDDLAAAFGLDDSPDDEGAAAEGVVVLLAGMGGPDALRQLLSALPPKFPVAVLVWQQLNAGTHDRLASQLAKTGKVDTYVAQVGGDMPAGKVGILPPGVGVSAEDGIGFVENGASPRGLLGGLRALGSKAVVVVLSGAEEAWLEDSEAWTRAGGQLLVQAPDTCFEAATCQALANRGVDSGLPTELAARALARWQEDY
jgi:chemosensory pili system protein ChpB (putative protein-glutamate methylesterase)